MTNKNTFRLVRPECPSCKSDEVYILRSLKNYLLIVIDTIFSLFLCPPFSYKLKCGKCGHEYKVHSKDR
jgi:DNA-directed RNA polymerase subunit M/transcription elongation factor TFIIS